MAFSTDSNGSLTGVTDSWSYEKKSGVHGLALSERDGQQLIYSADLSADILWTHAVNRTTKKVHEVSRFPMNHDGMHPRHVAAHPNGQFLYVVMEADNSLAQFDLNPATGAVTHETIRHSLLPIGTPTHSLTHSLTHPPLIDAVSEERSESC
jgi:carboxy-cis,cis-muconate cyclase